MHSNDLSRSTLSRAWRSSLSDSDATEDVLSVRRSTYDSSFFSLLFGIEDRHFWFRNRNRLIEGAVDRLTAALPSGYRVLEVGCGTGYVLQMLERVCGHGTVVGMDPSPEALSYAEQRTSCKLIRGELQEVPQASFDVICLFDVLEHLPDDAQALRTAFRALRPGGYLMLTVPAYQWLWSYFDDVSHHQRRYSRSELARSLAEAGFTVQHSSYLFLALVPLMWLSRRFTGWLGHREGGAGIWKRELAMRQFHVGPVLNSILHTLVAWESRVIKTGGRLPLGSSLLAIARKN